MKTQAPIQVSDRDEQQAIEKFWRSIKRNLDADQRADFGTYGGEGGFPNYVYYTDNKKHYNRHEDAIWSILQYVAEESGEYESGIKWLAGSTYGDKIYNSLNLANYAVWAAIEIMCQAEESQNERYEDW